MHTELLNHHRRRWLQLAGALLLSGPLAAAQAADFPHKPLRLIVGFPAGSTTDLLARELAEGLRQRLGQPVLVENVPGAGSTIAAARAARAAPDGHTLYLALLGHLLASFQHEKLPYDTLGDFAPVARISDTRFLIVVNPKVPAKDLRSFVELAKRSPGKFSYGSSGRGAGNHLMVERFALRAGIELLHVPYKSATEALQAVLSGDIDMTFFNAPAVMAHLNSGALKTFGVGGSERDPFAPNVPSMAEAGFPDFEATTYNFVLAPRGVPEPVLAQLNRVLNEVVASPAFGERLKALGATPSAPLSPDQLGQYLRREMDAWAPVLSSSGGRP